MARPIKIEIVEDVNFLKSKVKALSIAQHKRVEMLILIKNGVLKTKSELATALCVCEKSIQTWRTTYKKLGLAGLLTETRGGAKKAQISGRAYTALEKRLSSPTGGFVSYGEAQKWLNEKFGLQLSYIATNKFITRKFGAKPKVGRKSHVLKDPTATAVFKKPSREARTY